MVDDPDRGRRIAYINLKLAAMGLPVFRGEGTALVEMAREMLEHHRERGRLLAGHLAPVDARIQAFLDEELADGFGPVPRLPGEAFVLDRPGMAREMSLPPDRHRHRTPDLESFRIRNGILHNPARDRRTTEGVFHVVDSGFPVPHDKKAVPRETFRRLLETALRPDTDRLELPFTAGEDPPARAFVSLYLRPVVQPAVPGAWDERTMEIHVLAPGSLVASLDFLEHIFGNAGDPWLAVNDAALDPLGWTGHSGLILLAPHLSGLRKRDLGLPRVEEASDRQRRDGMCWADPDERYNDGRPFKVTLRGPRGCIVTLIADSYFGYAKKEVKSQVSFAANLAGLAEEEHAGGALVFASYNHGTRFVPDLSFRGGGHTLEGALALLGDRVLREPEGHARLRDHPAVVLIPEDAVLGLEDQAARFRIAGEDRVIPLRPEEVYVHPSGYQVRMERHRGSRAWRLIGTAPEGLFCHKPCTVSGGGKSEISKSLWNQCHFAPVVVGDYEADLARVREIIGRCYGDRFRDPARRSGAASRPLLALDRSLGSVIALLSPSPDYTDDYNAWIRGIPERIKALVYLVKRFYLPEWGEDWESHFGVDVMNGTTGNLFLFEGRPLLGTYLRVGYTPEGRRWVFKMRQDVMPARKVQMEDDITASITLPASRCAHRLPPGLPGSSVKFCHNLERHFFQRPDDAIHRGADRQAERDLAREGNFVSNFEPLPVHEARAMADRVVDLDRYTPPMQQWIRETAQDDRFEWFVASDRPRVVEGRPSQNPRYLQPDPSRRDPLARVLADLGPRLARRIPWPDPVLHPVGAILPARRLNPREPGSDIRPLAVYGPIHFQELPDLFADFLCSLSGKSPSTTGAGSEGALTKGPFNALPPVADVNNALLSFILTGHGGFTTAAGFVGPRYRVDHDLSLLIPELWCRMDPEERDPRRMIARGYLEPVRDFHHRGRLVPASRLGWRITPLFAAEVLGRLFDNPTAVFPEEVLRPEKQDLDHFADGVWHIVEMQQRVARHWIEDGSAGLAIPPLKALLERLAEGRLAGEDWQDPAFRELFARERVLASDWYRDRLVRYRDRERDHLRRGREVLRDFVRGCTACTPEARSMALQRLEAVEDRLARVEDPAFPESLVGTLGLDCLAWDPPVPGTDPGH